MLTVTDSITNAGKDNYPNEDMIIISEKFYIVLDGATSLGQPSILNAVSDAYWFVNMFKKYFLANEKLYPDIKILIKHTLFDIEVEYKKVVLDVPKEKYQFPSAGMVLVYEANDNTVEAYRLGDCELFHCSNSCVTKVFSDSNLNELDAISINELKSLLDDGYSYTAARKMIMRTLQKHRGLMNTKNGYWVLSIIESDIDKIIENIDQSIIKLKKGDKLLLVSDGYSAIIDKYQQTNIFKYTLQETITNIRNIENKDSMMKSYPRLKKSDDASALLLLAK